MFGFFHVNELRVSVRLHYSAAFPWCQRPRGRFTADACSAQVGERGEVVIGRGGGEGGEEEEESG